MRNVYRSVVLFSFTLLLATTARADLVSNGSFETFSGTFGSDGGAELTTASTTLTGWTIVDGEVAVLTTPNSYQLSAFDGINFMDLTGYSNAGFPKGVSQVLTGLTTGQTYAFSMELGVDNGACSGLDCAGPISVSASIGGNGQTFTDNPSGSGNIWSAYGFDFVADAASETLTILGQGASGHAYIGLDDVSVTPGSVAAVPEPASFALLLAGLVLVGGVARRRCR